MVTDERARALATEYGVPYIDTSAKENRNVDEAFMQLASSIKRVTEEQAAAAAAAVAETGGAAAAPAGSDGAEVQPLVLTGEGRDQGSSSGGGGGGAGCC